MPPSKAKTWAAKLPPDRVKLHRGMAAHLRAVADLTTDPREAVQLRLVARGFVSVAARVQHTIDKETRGDCCAEQRMFGDCRCQ